MNINISNNQPEIKSNLPSFLQITSKILNVLLYINLESCLLYYSQLGLVRKLH